MRSIRRIARALALIWACGWALFGLLAGIGEGYDLVGVFRHTAFPGLAFLVVALIAWRWEIVGGILLILEACGTLFLFWFSRTPEGFLTLTLPPLIAGVLFIVDWIRATRTP